MTRWAWRTSRQQYEQGENHLGLGVDLADRVKRAAATPTQRASALRTMTGALIATAMAFMFATPAAAQGSLPPPPGAFQPGNAVCSRLEAQLGALDRGGNDARAEQIRRYEEAVARQQQELERLTTQHRRQGCEGGFFLFGGGQSPQCDQINGQIQRMRGNLDRMLAGLRQLQTGGSGQEDQRRAIMTSLAQNNCGPQYRQAARPRGFFETLFGGPSRSGGSGSGFETTSPDSWGDPNQSSTFRTVCVRTCDGSFFPISFSTNQSRFREDERICQRMCPATEVYLYTHRNPGEDISQAVSLNGQPYTNLPTAFRFRQEFNPSCTCKQAGQSWSEAVGEDQTIERGDVVVTEERARTLSQPKQAAPKQQQKQPPARARNTAQTQPTAAAEPLPPPPRNAPTGSTTPASPSRTVGPQFYR
jgi:hypothetical protein